MSQHINSGSFKKGQHPWNYQKKNVYTKDTLQIMSDLKKGKHISIKTEFKKGQKSWNKDKILPPRTELANEKTSKSLKIFYKTDKGKEKIIKDVERMSGEHNPTKRPEVRIKLSLASKGKPKSELHRLHIKEYEAKMKINPSKKYLLRIKKLKAIKGEKHRLYGTHLSLEQRSVKSKSATKRILSNPEHICNGGYGKKGWFWSVKNNTNIYYRSTWELKYYKYLEDKLEVIGYKGEPFMIEYLFEGSNHNYVPDILVEYDNSSKELVEIKPSFRLKEAKTIAKIEAGRMYCVSKGLSFLIIDENFICKLDNIQVKI